MSLLMRLTVTDGIGAPKSMALVFDYGSNEEQDLSACPEKFRGHCSVFDGWTVLQRK